MKKLSNINESVWNDMRKRSLGTDHKEEEVWITELVLPFIERHNLKKDEYRINGDSVDIFRNVRLTKEDLVDKKLPFPFGKIDGSIGLSDLELYTLENSPREVTGDFVIYSNHLRNFIGGPEKVGGDFAANVNYSLESLDGSPKEVGKNYSILVCSFIKDIKGITPNIGGNLECTKNLSFSDDDFRRYSNIKGEIIRK